MDINQIELKPCAFCGNQKPELIEVSTAPGHWRVGCCKCGSYNNYSRDRERAVKQWNQRAPSSPSESPSDGEMLEAVARIEALSQELLRQAEAQGYDIRNRALIPRELLESCKALRKAMEKTPQNPQNDTL